MLYLQLPLSSKDWLDRYYKLGLRNKVNFYGAYMDTSYNEKYGTLAKVNSRHSNASFDSVDELKEAMEIIEQHGDKFSYVLNTHHILSDLTGIQDHIHLVNDIIKPKSVIISDLAFFDLIDKNIDLNISSFVGINNSSTLNFFLDNYDNIKRVIYQRDIILSDVEKIQQTIPQLEYEIFIKNMWCYHNGHCSSYHKDKTKVLCLREKSIKNPKGVIKVDKMRELQKTKLDCKACSLYKIKQTFALNKNNSLYLKIPGREFEIEKVAKDAKFIDLAIEGCKSSKSEKEFIAKNIRNHRLIFGRYCDYTKCEFYLGVQNKNNEDNNYSSST